MTTFDATTFDVMTFDDDKSSESGLKFKNVAVGVTAANVGRCDVVIGDGVSDASPKTNY